MRSPFTDLLRAVACLSMLSLAACASMMRGPEPEDLRVLREVADQIEPLTPLPEASWMHPEIELVTFSQGPWEGGEQRRDTIRAPEAAEEWLQDLHAWRELQTLQSSRRPPERPMLRSSEIFLCEGAAVQRGYYSLPTSGPHRLPESRRFMAHWVPDEGGGWLLRGIWFEPASQVRVAALASGCVSPRQLRIRAQRFALSAEFALQDDLFRTPVREAMIAAGWNADQPTRGDFPRMTGGTVALMIHASYRVTERVKVSGIYSRPPGGSGQGWNPEVGGPSLSWGSHQVAAPVLWKVGPMWIGAGPAWSAVDVDWFHGNFSGAEPRLTERSTLFGGMGQLSTSVPVTPWVEFTFQLRYWLLGNTEVPGYLDLPPLRVPLDHGALGLGLGVRL